MRLRLDGLGEPLIEAGWLVLAAGLPSFFAPWGQNPFELPKAMLLWFIVAIMGAAWLATRQQHSATIEQRSPHGPWPWAVLAFLAVVVLATCSSVNPLTSAQGSYDRMQGALTLLCYAALFLLVADRLRRPSQVHRLLAFVAWGSVPVVAYGLLQAVGLDPLGWQVEGAPAISSLGRSNFLGAYLVLVMPLTLASAWRAPSGASPGLLPKGWWRSPRSVAYGGLLGAQFACLVATQAQAAWLGALAAAGVLLAAAAWTRGHRRAVCIVVPVAAAGLLAGLAVLSQIRGLEGSLGARSLIWRATGSLIAARPILGYGPETYSQVFTRVFPPELVYVQGRAVLVDRAHNLVLDILASAGVLGLLAYGALVGTALVTGLRALARTPDRQAQVVVVAALAAGAGHLVETQFSFPVTTTAVLFWLALGVLVAPWSEPLPAPAAETARGREGRTAWYGMVLAVLLLASLVPTSLTFLLADAYEGQARQTEALLDVQRSIAAAQKAVALWPGQSIYYQRLSWLHLQAARRGYAPPAEFRSAEAALDAARQLTPGDYRVWAGYGELSMARGQAGDAARFSQAEEAYRHATALFPGSGMLHTGWGLLYVAQDRLAEAAAQFHQAVALDNTDAQAYAYLGDALLRQGELDGAEEAYRNALRWAPEMAAAYTGLGRIYDRWGWPDTALRLTQRALDLAPNDPDLYLDEARCQEELGQWALACQSVENGLLVAPGHPDLLAFRARCVEQLWKGGD